MKTETINKSGGRLAFIATISWVITYLGALLLLKEFDLAIPLKIVLAFLPFVFFLNGVFKLQKHDELHIKVIFEAAATAFFLTLLFLMTLGLLELAIPLSKENFSLRHIWQYCTLFYFIGLAMEWRRYKA